MAAVAFDYFTQIETPRERLAVTLFIAFILHLILVFGFGFEFTKPTRLANSPMDIILVQTESQKESVEEADYLAQASQEGGGDTDRHVRPTVQAPAMFPDPEPVAASSTAPQLAAPAEVPVIEELTVSEPAEEKAQEVQVEQEVEAPPAEGADSNTLPPEEEVSALDLIVNARHSIAALQASLEEKAEAYAKRPRHKYIGARTKEYRYAGYMENWRRKIERIGTLNYPHEARMNDISGELILDVAINIDGTVHEIKIIEASKHAVLNDAAIRIVRLAAPFAPFPENISDETDILHITRRWQFSSGDVISF